MTNGEVLEVIFHQATSFVGDDYEVFLIVMSRDGKTGRLLSTLDKPESIEFLEMCINSTVRQDIGP